MVPCTVKNPYDRSIGVWDSSDFRIYPVSIVSQSVESDVKQYSLTCHGDECFHIVSERHLDFTWVTYHSGLCSIL